MHSMLIHIDVIIITKFITFTNTAVRIIKIILHHVDPRQDPRAADCAECETKEGKIDRIERTVELAGPLDARRNDCLCWRSRTNALCTARSPPRLRSRRTWPRDLAVPPWDRRRQKREAMRLRTAGADGEDSLRQRNRAHAQAVHTTSDRKIRTYFPADCCNRVGPR